MKSLLVSTLTGFTGLLLDWVVVAATPRAGAGTPSPHLTVCKDEAVCGKALGFAILRDGVVIQFVAATSLALKKTGQGRAAQNQVGSGRCCAVFLRSLSLQQIH